jgi:uncharacterized membrane protein YfcA
LAQVFAHLSFAQLVLVAGAALFASVIGGVAGYGTGLLLPLVLVPILGPEPVVPVMAIAALLINASRVTAFRAAIDLRRTLIVLATAIPACMLGAWFYTRLSMTGTQLVIGAFLIVSVPLRRFLQGRGFRLSEAGLAAGGAGFGAITGTAPGTGVILISMLMAAGMSGAAVIATDAAISVVVHFVQAAVFGVAGVIDLQVIAVAALIGLCSIPGAFLARALVDRLPVQLHAWVLEIVVLLGGVMMVAGALTR